MAAEVVAEEIVEEAVAEEVVEEAIERGEIAEEATGQPRPGRRGEAETVAEEAEQA